MYIYRSNTKFKHKHPFVYYLGVSILITLACVYLLHDQIYKYQEISKWVFWTWISCSFYITIAQYLILKKKFNVKLPRKITPVFVYNKAIEIKNKAPLFFKIAFVNLVNIVSSMAGLFLYLLLTGAVTF